MAALSFQGLANASLINGGFESGNLSGWTFSAATNVNPVIAPGFGHSGAYGAFLGRSTGPYGFTMESAIYQDVFVTSACSQLSFWYYPSTQDSISYDWQECLIKNTSNATLATVMHICSNANSWTQVNYSLSAYVGTTIRLYFNVHDDSASDPTYMYLDEISLGSGCGGPGAGNAALRPGKVINFPNPLVTGSGRVTNFSFDPCQSATIDIFDLAGRKFTTLDPSQVFPLNGSASWNGSGPLGFAPPGFYLYLLRTDQGVKSGKLTLAGQ